jgi:hypothetical protein
MGLTGRHLLAAETASNMDTGMKFVLDTLMIFFATLAVAAVVALGEPAEASSPVLPAPAAQPSGAGR